MSWPCPASVSPLTPIGLVGPTAAGKSSLALCMAERLGGEIISVDSMQVYRGLDIGTAKPTRADQSRVPHHLIDVAELTESFDAARFISFAQLAINKIQRRGRIPILCGGTGLYLQALVAGLGSAPAPEATVRAELERVPIEQLLAELERADHYTFERIDRRNPRRVIRAIEVIRLTGRPFSEQQASWAAADRPNVVVDPIFGLCRDRVDLHRRIDTRVDAMFEAGLVQETEAAVSRGLAANHTARQAIGYRQVLEHLVGERDLVGTIALVKQRTRQYARRQMTWFRKQRGVIWLRPEPDDPVEQVLSHLVDARTAGEISRA